VREQLADALRCPRCLADRSLELAIARRDAREVRDGELACVRCGARFPVFEGVADLLPDPPAFVARESAGLERFAQVMRADGWDGERLRRLPDVDLPYWHGQRRAIDALLARHELVPGALLADIGSNTCWASRIFAERGLRVIALDVALGDLQGLGAAEHQLDSGVYFERVRSTMFAPAIASASLDYVFCCEVLHHNDPAHLRRTLRELHRVLRAGGRLFLVNEPMRFPLMRKRDHGREVAEFEGNEHVYYLHEYYLAARLAGFQVKIPALAPARAASRRSRARALWRHLVAGDTPLTMDCRKPR
jgi:SAM-dependent methyltransferase/uncharacterized protein YbaR (Trm112 family)